MCFCECVRVVVYVSVCVCVVFQDHSPCKWPDRAQKDGECRMRRGVGLDQPTNRFGRLGVSGRGGKKIDWSTR